MWCPQCESDVAGEMSADGQSLLCSRCSTSLQKVFAPSLHPETLAARQLLERWSRQGLSLPFDSEATEQPAETAASETAQQPVAAESIHEVYPLKQVDDAAVIEKAAPPTLEESAAKIEPSGHKSWRVDTPHPRNSRPKHARRKPPREFAMKSSAHSDSAQRRSDGSHDDLPNPHFDVGKIAERPQPGRSESIWGQVLAYSGVGVLTLGTVLVVWGYFGGIESYASTGWLLSTAGQMLLLLGVVTLVSGGMQLTTHEVGQRIEYLNGRMYRIERSTQRILRGPHFGNKSSRQRRSNAGRGNSENADRE